VRVVLVMTCKIEWLATSQGLDLVSSWEKHTEVVVVVHAVAEKHQTANDMDQCF
jgi:hypothetical protein